MTYGTITSEVADGGAAMVTTIKSQLSASGWNSIGGGTFEVTTGGTTLSVSIPGSDFASGHLQLSTNGITRYLSIGTTAIAGKFVRLEYSISQDHFYVVLSGPSAGAGGDPTGGGIASSVLFTRYVPYSASNSDTSKHWVSIASKAAENYVVSSQLQSNIVTFGITGASNESGNLMTMKPLTEGTGIGNLPESKIYQSGIVYWPVVLMSPTIGLIGRVRNVFFGSESFLSGGDATSSLANDPNVMVGSTRYTTSIPCAWPSTSGLTSYSAWGTMIGSSGYGASTTGTLVTSNTGSMGPYIIVKRGDGS